MQMFKDSVICVWKVQFRKLIVIDGFFYGTLFVFLAYIQANAQEKFMRIKHAYSALLNSETRRKYDSGNRTSGFSYSTNQRQYTQDEEFYGFGKNCIPVKSVLL